MTSPPRLDTLPKELIAQIATLADVRSAILLSRICRRTRSAVYDSFVFKSILETSQRTRWKRDSLQLQAVDQAACRDPELWLRFAIADQKAWELAQLECPLEFPSKIQEWLPELFTVRHPFIYHQCWDRMLGDGQFQPMQQVFCQAVAILASSENMPQLANGLRRQEDTILRRGTGSHDTFLWALCSIALTLRMSLRTRLAAWPYNNDAHVPFIQPVRLSQIPMISQDLPIPFGGRGLQPYPSNTWYRWYQACNERVLKNVELFTSGTWCGYYSHFGIYGQSTDPPMMNIKFRVVPRAETHMITLRADECVDGIGEFSIEAGFTKSGSNFFDQVEFLGQKTYNHVDLSWLWDMRVTPFGLCGFWGVLAADDSSLDIERHGTVWLWKEEWTKSGDSYQL